MKLRALYECKVGDTFTYVPGGFKLKVYSVNDAPETKSGKVVTLKDTESGERHTFDMDDLTSNEDYQLNESLTENDGLAQPFIDKYGDDASLWEIADKVMKSELNGQQKADVLYKLIRWEEGG